MTATAPPPVTRQRPVGWIVATAVLGTVVIALGLFVVRSTAEETAGQSADAAARTSCELVGQVPAGGFEAQTDGDRLSAQMSRLNAAYALALLAANLDDKYQDLSRTTQLARLVLQQDLDGTDQDFIDALAEARDTCAEPDR